MQYTVMCAATRLRKYQRNKLTIRFRVIIVDGKCWYMKPVIIGLSVFLAGTIVAFVAILLN